MGRFVCGSAREVVGVMPDDLKSPNLRSNYAPSRADRLLLGNEW